MMFKDTFEYKPLANNKNDREFKVDVKRAGIPPDALYVKFGNINDRIVRYIVMWGDGVDVQSLKDAGHKVKTVAALLEPLH
jgi:hypothetical protein